jgi:hypothetical protein
MYLFQSKRVMAEDVEVSHLVIDVVVGLNSVLVISQPFKVDLHGRSERIM